MGLFGMPACPSCGGNMRYDRKVRMFICKGCGLSLSKYELDSIRDQRLEKVEEEVEVVDEYLEWWMSRKK